MLYFKSSYTNLSKCFDFLIKRQKEGTIWGFMYRDKKTKELVMQKGLNSLEEVLDMLIEINIDVTKFDSYQIAFYQSEHSNPKDCMPLVVSKNMKEMSRPQKYKGERDNLEFEKVKGNIIMLNPLRSCTSLYESNIKYTPEKDYIYNILTSFKDKVLENQIQFFGKFGIFDNVDFIMLNKNTGFKFIGKYRTAKGGINNSDIFYSKSMVYNEE